MCSYLIYISRYYNIINTDAIHLRSVRVWIKLYTICFFTQLLPKKKISPWLSLYRLRTAYEILPLLLLFILTYVVLYTCTNFWTMYRLLYAHYCKCNMCYMYTHKVVCQSCGYVVMNALAYWNTSPGFKFPLMAMLHFFLSPQLSFESALLILWSRDSDPSGCFVCIS